MNNTPGACSFMTKNTPNAGIDYLQCVTENSTMYPAPCVYTDPPSGYNSARSRHSAKGVNTIAGRWFGRFCNQPDRSAALAGLWYDRWTGTSIRPMTLGKDQPRIFTMY